MPLYEYRCGTCQRRNERYFANASLAPATLGCLACANTAVKVPSAFSTPHNTITQWDAKVDADRFRSHTAHHEDEKNKAYEEIMAPLREEMGG